METLYAYVAFCEENLPGTDEFTSQRASDVEAKYFLCCYTEQTFE